MVKTKTKTDKNMFYYIVKLDYIEFLWTIGFITIYQLFVKTVYNEFAVIGIANSLQTWFFSHVHNMWLFKGIKTAGK